ncbi:MAG: ChaN family lipoprotein [Pseudomonadota bacterium]
MRWIAVILVVLSAGLARAESYGSALEHRIWDLRTGQEIDRAALVEALSGADVALLGEVHDNADAHMAQGALVRLLQPVALAVEMIPIAQEADLNAYLADGGETVGIGKAVAWDTLGWPAWDLYRPVFKYFTPGLIKGAALDRDEVRRSMTDGAAAIPLDPPMADRLDKPLAEDIQAALEDEMVVAHCGHLPKEMAPGMIEAQRLRDAALASAVLRARAAKVGQVAVIAGNGHTRTDRGVGTYLGDDLSVLSVGLLEADIGIAPEAVGGSELPYDFVWFVPPAEREDPCAVFKKRKN